MLSIKIEYNIPHDCFNDFIGLIKETNPTDNLIPSDLYRTKKLVSKLGLTATKIDCCINGCMLYYKDDAAELFFRTCNAPRFKPNSRKQRHLKKDVSYSRLFYLPIIPRLQQLYASKSSADHMRWHKYKIAKNVVLSHPSDAEAWKHFCYYLNIYRKNLGGFLSIAQGSEQILRGEKRPVSGTCSWTLESPVSILIGLERAFGLI
ncbi:hypothetical protein MA16_Dca026668 [Dendrobium catenatum]|uniref:Uncharacterized protein n=1 Tax=Dendrobium catenatum TaxID=906689 RepID=A0A2I0VMS9_9ASPA|nr:hypothetical protein MA16_Dca026668 [Dendrobium catenatum]